MVKYILQEEQMLGDLRGLLKIKSVNGECGEVTAQAPLGGYLRRHRVYAVPWQEIRISHKKCGRILRMY